VAEVWGGGAAAARRGRRCDRRAAKPARLPRPPIFLRTLRGAKDSGAAACERRALAAAKKRGNLRATLSRPQVALNQTAAPPRSTQIIHLKACEAPRCERDSARRSLFLRAPSLTLHRASALAAPPRSTEINHLRCVRRRGPGVERRGAHIYAARPPSPRAAPLHPPTRSPTRLAALHPRRHRALPAAAFQRAAARLAAAQHPPPSTEKIIAKVVV